MSRKTRNLIWSVPLVATLAIVGALALFITLAPNDASAQQGEEAPGMPTELMLRALDQTTIELTWEAPSNEALVECPMVTVSTTLRMVWFGTLWRQTNPR